MMPLPSITVTYLGHACVLVEVESPTGSARLLLDPGNLTAPLEGIGAVDAVLVTHAHPDHLDPAQVRRVSGGGLAVFGPSECSSQLDDLDVMFTPVEAGVFEVNGVAVEASRAEHEQLYAGVPLPENFGYDIGGRVYAPGDSLAAPSTSADVLLVPTAGPWMKLSEGIDYLRAATSARTAVPIHDGGLGPAHRALHHALLAKFAPEGTSVAALDPGDALAL